MDDDQDFDQTQAIFLEDFDQETDEEVDNDKQTPVAYLKVSCQKGFPEKIFPLFEGDNVIGRHEESCNVCIPLKALSREHACIEIKGESHLIYDKNSRNKTKRNKLFLSPDVRYELKNGDKLIFGDVTSKYSINNKDEGSETESESDYQTANDVEQKDITVEVGDEEYDSDNSVDLLQPTQAYTNHAHKSVVGRSLLADDSLVEKETTVLVSETPAPSRQKVTTGPVIEESGSETEDEDIVARNAPQTLLVEESQKDESCEGDILYAQTQAYVAESDGEDITDNEEDHKTIFTEPTQAFTDVDINEKSEVEATQTFVADSDTEGEEDEKKKSFQYAATQAYNAVDDFEEEEEATQTTEDEGEAVVETDEEDVSHLFTSSTLACDIDDFTEDGGQQVVTSNNQENETQVTLDEPTQAVDEDDLATQVFPGDEQTKVTKDDHEYATQVIEDVQKSHPVKKPVNFDDATVAIKIDATLAMQEAATVAVQIDATLAVQEDATLAVQEEATVAVQEEATVAVQEDATVAVNDDVSVAVQEEATVAVQEDATVAVQEDATVAVNDDVAVHDNSTVAVQEDATVPVQDEATLVVQDNVSVAGHDASDTKELSGSKKGKGRGRPKKIENKVGIPVELDISKTKGPTNKKSRTNTEDSSVTSSQESDDGNIRKSSRSKRKSFRIIEMEESLDDMKGIDKSIRKGEDYSPERQESEESPSPKRERRGRKRKSTENEQDISTEEEQGLTSLDLEKETGAPLLQKDIPPLPKETVKRTEAEFLMTLPALQNKDGEASVLTEATQAYTMEPNEELPKPVMVEATQPYCMMEEDSTPPLEEGGSGDKEGDITPPIEDVIAATQPYSMEEEIIEDSEETKPALISIPSRSPLKSAIVSPQKREKKSPSPKRVQFTVKKIDSSSTEGSENSGTTGSDDKPTTSRGSRSTKVTRSKLSTESETDNEEVKPVKRGRRSVVHKDVTTDKEEVKHEEKQPTKTRGRRSVNMDKSQEVVSKTTKSRGRKPRESVTTDKKKDVIDEKEESDEEIVALISDGESKDDEQHKPKAVSPVRKGRSKATKTATSSQETENSEKGKNVKITGDGAENVGDSTKSSPVIVKAAGRKGRSAVHKTDESDEKIKDGSLNNAHLKETDEHEQENKTDSKLDNIEKINVGRKRRTTVHKLEDKVLEDKTETNEKIVENLGASEKDNESENKTVTKSKVHKGKAPAKSQIESETVPTKTEKMSESDKSSNITKQSGRRGRSSVIPGIERRESGESEKDFKDTKPTGKRGKVSVIKNESANQIEESEGDSKNKVGRSRRGRSVIVQNGNKKSEDESKINETESAKENQKGHRSSSQPPLKITEETKSVGRGRRGKSFIHTSEENKEEASMPPPKSVGVRGKKNNETVEEKNSKTVNNDKRQSRMSKANEIVESDKGGKDKKREVDGQEILDHNESDTSSRSRSSSRKRNKESEEDTQSDGSDSKPTRGKRKHDSRNDNENLPATSKKTKTEKTLVESSESESETKSVRSRGRISNVKSRTSSQEEVNSSRSNSRSRSQQNESKNQHLKKDDVLETKTKEPAESKVAHKRGMKVTETSTGTPPKKAKLKDKGTPQTSKTVAIGSPSLRRKSVIPNKPKVMFTGVVDEHGQKIIKDLGGELINSVFDCTHLVTDKIRRTVKFLCCLARGIPIVTLQWIESCKQSAMFVDWSIFQVKDTATEKQFKFTLHRSLEKAQEDCLLQGYKIHVTKSVKPEPNQMKDIIECAGAEFLTSMPKKGGNNIVIISCTEDESLCTPAIKAGVPVVNSEFILTGILRQEVDIKSYALFTEAKESQTSATSGRRRR